MVLLAFSRLARPYTEGMRGTGGNGDPGCANDIDGRDGPGDGVRARAGAWTAGADGAYGTGGCDWERRAFMLSLSLSRSEDVDATLESRLL